MKQKIDWNKNKLLQEAPDLIAKALKAGWMAYPKGQRFLADGSLDPMLHPVEEVQQQKYTPELCRQAYEMRQIGMALDSIANVCKVPRGSVVYLVSKGHEAFLEAERHCQDSTNSPTLPTDG